MKRLMCRVLCFVIFLPTFAYADFDGSLQAMADWTIGRIFPIGAFFFCGDAAYAFIRKAPDYKEKIQHAAIGTVALAGIHGIWNLFVGFANH